MQAPLPSSTDSSAPVTRPASTEQLRMPRQAPRALHGQEKTRGCRSCPAPGGVTGAGRAVGHRGPAPKSLPGHPQGCPARSAHLLRGRRPGRRCRSGVAGARSCRAIRRAAARVVDPAASMAPPRPPPPAGQLQARARPPPLPAGQSQASTAPARWPMGTAQRSCPAPIGRRRSSDALCRSLRGRRNFIAGDVRGGAAARSGD